MPNSGIRESRNIEIRVEELQAREHLNLVDSLKVTNSESIGAFGGMGGELPNQGNSGQGSFLAIDGSSQMEGPIVIQPQLVILDSSKILKLSKALNQYKGRLILSNAGGFDLEVIEQVDGKRAGAQIQIQTIAGETVTIKNQTPAPTGESIKTPDGNDFILGERQNVTLTYDSIGDEWVFSDSGLFGGSVNFPILPPIVDHGTIGLVTEGIDLSLETAHVHTMVIDGDVTFNFNNPPPNTKNIQFQLDITMDGVGGHDLTFNQTLSQTPNIDNSPNARTVLLFQTNDGGLNYDVFETSADFVTNPMTSNLDAAQYTIFNQKQIIFGTSGSFPVAGGATIYSHVADSDFVIQANAGEAISLRISTGAEFANMDESLVDFTTKGINSPEVRIRDLHVYNISQFDENMTLLTNGTIPQPTFSPTTDVAGPNDGGDLGTSSVPWNNLNVKQIRLRDGSVVIDAHSVAFDSSENGTVYNVGVQGNTHKFKEYDGVSSTNLLLEINATNAKFYSLIEANNNSIHSVTNLKFNTSGGVDASARMLYGTSSGLTLSVPDQDQIFLQINGSVGAQLAQNGINDDIVFQIQSINDAVPYLFLYRNDSTPNAGSKQGAVRFFGNSSDLGQYEGAAIDMDVEVTTAAANGEEASLHFGAKEAGNAAPITYISLNNSADNEITFWKDAKFDVGRNLKIDPTGRAYFNTQLDAFIEGDSAGLELHADGVGDRIIGYADGEFFTFSATGMQLGATADLDISLRELQLSGTTSTFLLDGAIWYNSTANKFQVRQNGITEDMIGGGATGNEISQLNSSIVVTDAGSGVITTTVDGQTISTSSASIHTFFKQLVMSGIGISLGNQNITSIGRLQITNNMSNPSTNGHMNLVSTDVKVYSGGALRNLSEVGNTNIDDFVPNASIQTTHLSTHGGADFFVGPHLTKAAVPTVEAPIIGNNVMYAYPIWIAEDTTLDRFGLYVGTPNGTPRVHFGLFTNRTDGELYPETKVVSSDNALMLASNQIIEYNVANTALTKGLYWLCIIFTGTLGALTVGHFAAADFQTLFSGIEKTDFLNGPRIGWFESPETSIPATFPDGSTQMDWVSAGSRLPYPMIQCV